MQNGTIRVADTTSHIGERRTQEGFGETSASNPLLTQSGKRLTWAGRSFPGGSENYCSGFKRATGVRDVIVFVVLLIAPYSVFPFFVPSSRLLHIGDDSIELGPSFDILFPVVF